MHAISAKLYEAAAAEMAEQEEAGADASDDGVVDADFEVVEETKTDHQMNGIALNISMTIGTTIASVVERKPAISDSSVPL